MNRQCSQIAVRMVLWVNGCGNDSGEAIAQGKEAAVAVEHLSQPCRPFPVDHPPPSGISEPPSYDTFRRRCLSLISIQALHGIKPFEICSSTVIDVFSFPLFPSFTALRAGLTRVEYGRGGGCYGSCDEDDERAE